MTAQTTKGLITAEAVEQDVCDTLRLALASDIRRGIKLRDCGWRNHKQVASASSLSPAQAEACLKALAMGPDPVIERARDTFYYRAIPLTAAKKGWFKTLLSWFGR